MKKLDLDIKSLLTVPAGLQQAVYYMPLWQKAAVWAAALLIPCAVFWFAFFQPRYTKMKRIEGELPKLRAEVARLERDAKRLPEVEADVKRMEEILNEAMRLLPESKDIPSVLTRISGLGNEEHLEFLSFQPGRESKKDFYAEIPLTLRLRGPFHNTMRFFDKMAHMDRIVQVRDVSMGGAQKMGGVWSQAGGAEAGSKAEGGGSWVVSTSVKAVTYRFLTKEEQAALKKSKKKRKKRRRRRR